MAEMEIFFLILEKWLNKEGNSDSLVESSEIQSKKTCFPSNKMFQMCKL